MVMRHPIKDAKKNLLFFRKFVCAYLFSESQFDSSEIDELSQTTVAWSLMKLGPLRFFMETCKKKNTLRK